VGKPGGKTEVWSIDSSGEREGVATDYFLGSVNRKDLKLISIAEAEGAGQKKDYPSCRTRAVFGQDGF